MSGDFKHLMWKGNKFLNVEQRAAPRCRIHLRRLLCILLTLCEIGKAEQMITATKRLDRLDWMTSMIFFHWLKHNHGNQFIVGEKM